MNSALLPLLIVATVLSALGVGLLIVLLIRKPVDKAADRVRSEVDRVNEVVRSELQAGRGESLGAARETREEIAKAVRELADSLQQRLGELRTTLDSRLQQMSDAERAADLQDRTELQNALKDFREAQAKRMDELGTRHETKLEAMRTTIETKLTQLQANNEAKLELIRQTVDEKLHQTLEQRLGESFKLVSERLEQVHSGLGEMKSLAVGVGDLKKILSNVKTRGTWGEVQLGNLLEQTLTPEQFVRNFAPNEDSPERVEFAIRLPGRDTDGTPVWLPLDSKFPNEEYQRLVEAQERGEVAAVGGGQRGPRARHPPGGAEDFREIHLPARDHRFRDPVSAHREPLCGGVAASGIERGLAAPVTAWWSPGRRRSPPCSPACKWASARSPSSSAPACSAR
ncbi:MAG: DNA recombination protein RmuC [Chthoniobacter sp.]